MKKLLLLGIFSIFFLSIGYTLGASGKSTLAPISEQVEEMPKVTINEQVIETPKITNTTCDPDISVGNKADIIQRDSFLQDFVKEKCILVHDIEYVDITGNGEKETIILSSGYGAASGRYRTFYVVSEGEEIFSKSHDNLNYEVIPEEKKIEITTPVARTVNGEWQGACCPDKAIVYTYELNGINFDLVDFRVEKY